MFYLRGAKKSLLIDDNLSLLAAYKNILTEEGYHVDTAENGAKGLEILKNKGHEIVITDTRFPPGEKDGFEIIKGAKEVNRNCEVI